MPRVASKNAVPQSSCWSWSTEPCGRCRLERITHLGSRCADSAVPLARASVGASRPRYLPWQRGVVALDAGGDRGLQLDNAAGSVERTRGG
ncbi:hypothetical protein NDU88_004171 [Pleurodeles waltl]|uniref:Uncharacterized protein n=1 Tax=Pleurodeles waltl TaxID=8319 RepID=A0AAV7LJ04_PLEWA|nr:hypothetical protein NDU88_004171 [Pleurodeles waltl]